MTLSYTLKISFLTDVPNKLGAVELIYDEIPFQTSYDLSAENDIVHGVVKSHKINLKKHNKKKAPIRNGMKLT